MKRCAVVIALGVVWSLHPGGAVAGDLEVAVAVADGKSVVRGTLIAEDQTHPLPAAGEILLKDLPDKRIAVTVDAVVGAKDGVRYLGVAVVKTVKGKVLPVTVTIKPVADIEAFCSDCHPYKGEELRPNQVYRDTHVSGKEISGPYLAQVEKYNAESERQRKEKAKDPQLPIILEKRVVMVAGKEVVKHYYNCESCHTTHLPTPWARKVRAPYRGSSVFCEGCHY